MRKEYSAYEKNNKKLQECEKEEKRLENRQNLTEEKINILEEKYREFGTQENILFRENETLQNNYQKFAGYQEAEKNTETNSFLDEEEQFKLEARYEAITAEISQELKDLEAEEEKALARYHKSSEELEELSQKYNLQKSAWENVLYDKKEKLHQEAELEDCDRKIEIKKVQITEEDKKIGILDSRLEDLSKRIMSECAKKEPLAEEKIRQIDLKSAQNQAIHQIKELEKKKDIQDKKLQSYLEKLPVLQLCLISVPDFLCIFEQIYLYRYNL